MNCVFTHLSHVRIHISRNIYIYIYKQYCLEKHFIFGKVQLDDITQSIVTTKPFYLLYIY